MRKRIQSNQNSGFTVVEMLAAVAILVILLGVSMVSIVRYRDLLKLTELDNAAREIYMAAENRAVLLSGARRLSSQVSGVGNATTLSGRAGGAEDLYYVSKAAITEDLLTTGSIDPTLRGGDFYIVYDRNSSSVTDVFYAEEPMDALVSGGFETFYHTWAKSRSERLKLKDEMLVGWYNGEAAQGMDIELEIPEEPAIKVLIKNGEELTVTVEYTAPGEADLSVTLGDIDLTDSAYTVRKQEETTQIGSNGVAYRCTWVLDSLTAGKFAELGNTGVNPGDNITVTAAVASVDGSFETASDSDTNNSLFQEGSGEAIAYVKYLRHLQNLDAVFSGVLNKTSAIQTDDVRCKGNETYEDYDFIPLYNGKLESYDGRTKEIRGLYVSGTKFTGDNAHAGLFSRTGGGTSNRPMTFQRIRLVNASVKAAGDNYAGALVGYTSDATIQNCWVYWEPDGEITDLKAVLGSDGEGDEYHYQIAGKCAGGLVGYSKGNCTITNSLAATLVSGADCAGGLLGVFEGSTATIRRSYADCYLTGDAKAAGLIGNLESGNAVLQNCYAAGYILGGNQAAGLCLGKGTTTAANVYSAMRYPGRNISDTFTFLTQNQGSDSFTNVHFLGKDSQKVGTIDSTLYADMTGNNFVTTMGEAFERKTWEDSHPYNLREHLFLNVYSYPGLKNMPHYGDWGAEFKEPSLVYYEAYSDGSWGVSGGNARDLVNSLEDKKSIRSDGYAVAFLRDDLKADTVKVTYAYLDEKGAQQRSGPHEYAKDQLTSTQWANDDGTSADYYMMPLPDELVNSDFAQGCFYRYLKFELELSGEGDQPNGEYFFNPHFAETVHPVIAEGGTEGGWTGEKVTEYAGELAGNMNEIKVRTPRHLYDLSKFSEYYTRRDTFRQILDLDYATYVGYELFQGKPYAQQPIGRWNEAFAGLYDGGCYSVKNVAPAVNETAQRRYAGLFGYSTGTLRNIVYQMDPDHPVTAYLGSAAENLYVGALVGGSAGVMENCAVSGVNLRAGASGVKLYVGGLAGRNQGVIRNCAAESAQLSANCFNYASIYMGGLVGENAASRSINTSYAVGRINAEVDSTITTARICGFVGWNYGTISDSYAAVDLQSSGENVEIYGFCGVRAGSQSGTGYLDHGNFTYRGASYAANYSRDDDKASPVLYAELTTKEKAGSLGMGTVWTGAKPDPEQEFPYPAAVKDAKGDYIHYGQWPAPMPLGKMGVFYWEKLVDAEGGGNPTYHLSALAVDPAKKKTITKQSTLSETHNDGRVVVDYGYGYYSSKEVAKNVSLSVKNIGYTGYVIYDERKTHLNLANMDPNRKREESSRSGKREMDAEKAFSALVDEYEFHCWNTFREAPRKADNHDDKYRGDRAVSGLCLLKANAGAVLDPNSGTFTLSQRGAQNIQVTFVVNPQFADAMSVSDAGGLQVTGGASRQKPGTASNPYQVRSGVQLQDINWYDTAYTDVPVGLGNYQVWRFPYLSGDGYTRNYYWEQTHDIDWVEERKAYDIPDAANDDGVFFPIAQGFIANETTFLSGWFGGTYNGGSYTLKNFDIGLNTKNYQVNCMGLFGVVKGAVLKDIVMFSESGSDTVTVYGRSKDRYGDDASRLKSERNAWYAGGVLVGLAKKGDHGEGEITNCAVAGYTIVDQTECTRVQQLSDRNKPQINMEFINGTKYVDVGGAIGGLVGMTDMDLTGCTASVTIKLENTYPAFTGSNWNVPLRAGGLVGSTTGSVKNCYTGGTIDTSKSGCEIYVGTMTGGVGMVTGSYYERKEVSIHSCYSYMEIREGDGSKATVLKYAKMNGTYGGTTKRTNNYYLGDRWMATEAEGERTITYRQLANLERIDGQWIYDRLNAGQNPEPYNPVTSDIGGLAMAGRFSYAPKNRLELQGLDYPFPTVLTQTRVSDSMVFRVHYGGWALNGIERTSGGQPVELDMFTKRSHTETLRLSTGIPTGGIWSAEASVEDTVDASVATGDAEITLTVTARNASDTPVTVTVKYTAAGTTYSLPVTVYVTAHVELRPGTVSIFPNDTVNVPLTPYGIMPGTKVYQQLSLEGLEIIEVEGVGQPLAAEVVMPSETEEAGKPGVKLVRGDGETGERQVWVDVTYRYAEEGYPEVPEEKSHRMEANLLDLPENKWNESDGSWSIDFTDYKPTALEAKLQDSALENVTVGVKGSTITLIEKGPDAEFPENVKLDVVLTIDGLEHKVTIAVPPKSEENTVP